MYYTKPNHNGINNLKKMGKIFYNSIKYSVIGFFSFLNFLKRIK